MKFAELREQREGNPIPVDLEDGTQVEVYFPSVEGVKAVRKRALEQGETPDNTLEVPGLMLIACTREDLTEDQAQQAILDTGGYNSPLVKKLTELIYGKEAGQALGADPTPSGEPSESAPTS